MVERRRLGQGRGAVRRGRRLTAPAARGAARAASCPCSPPRSAAPSRPPRPRRPRRRSRSSRTRTSCSRPARSRARWRSTTPSRWAPTACARSSSGADVAPAPRAPAAGGLRPRPTPPPTRRALGRPRRPRARHVRARAVAAALPLHAGPRVGLALPRAGRSGAGSAGPDGGEYGAFVRALGRRYSGAYADENQGGGVLPRVGRWSFGNEPNQASWLTPQYAAATGSPTPPRPSPTARWCAARSPACAPRGHGGDALLLGETSPIGRGTGRLRGAPGGARAVHPHAAVPRARRPRAARAAGGADAAAARPRRLPVTGFAHHPYTQGGARPPRTRGSARDPDHHRHARAAGADPRRGRAARADRARAADPLHRVRLPDRPARRAVRRVARPSGDVHERVRLDRLPRPARSTRWRSTSWSTTRSWRASSPGVRFADGRPKPSYDAYRLPLWITRKGASHLRVYGQVRPLANGATTQVELQNAPLGLPVWRTVATFAVRSERGRSCRRSRGARDAGGCAGCRRPARCRCSRARRWRRRADRATIPWMVAAALTVWILFSFWLIASCLPGARDAAPDRDDACWPPSWASCCCGATARRAAPRPAARRSPRPPASPRAWTCPCSRPCSWPSRSSGWAARPRGPAGVSARASSPAPAGAGSACGSSSVIRLPSGSSWNR